MSQAPVRKPVTQENLQKEDSTLNNALQSRTPVAPETFPGVFWCPDLVSTRDLGPQGVEAVLHLAELMKSRPVRLPAVACRQTDGDVLREAFTPNPAHVRGGDEQPGRDRDVRGPVARTPRRSRNLERHRPQPRTLGRCDCAAYVCARNDRPDGALRVRPGDQRAQRFGASLPGAGGLLHAAGALRRSQEYLPGVRRRRQQCGAFVAADLRLRRIVDPDRHTERLRAECEDCCRGAQDRETDRSANRVAHRSAGSRRWSGCGLYRRVGQHGPGRREPSCAPVFSRRIR